MATPYIGSYFFDRMDIAMSTPAVVLEDITRPGVDGVAYRQVGYRGEPFPARTLVAVSTLQDAINLQIGYRNIMGTSVTVTDPNNTSWTDCIVIMARPATPQKFSGGVGGVNHLSSGFLVACEWLLQNNNI